ncbi:hypothetical protein, partial [Roseovarius sp.]|uniref:hypothetical protein n=1 Tax=Roseovarius sp. TaxID=1486281 RepID=UPI003569FCE0
HSATDAVTRATIGEGEITIRDEDAQRAREEAGETENIAALNRDLDAARETLRDERAGVRFYASDSSVRAAVEAVDFIGRTLSEISQEAFRNMNSESFDDIADALERDALSDEAIIAQLGACGASCPRHHLPTGRGGRHRHRWCGPSPRGHPPIASATDMRMTTIQAQTER